MKLVKFNYAQHLGEPQEWKLVDCTFGDINLIVGKNATGKTRTLNVIRALADLLSELTELKWKEGIYEVEFEHNGQTIAYVLEYHHRAVTKELLTINSDVRLTRGPGGEGEIYAADDIKKMIRFRVPENQVAAFAKRDSIQHPFLEELYEWGKGVIRYDFGTLLGKDHFVVIKQAEEDDDATLDLRQTQKVVAIFLDGLKKYSKDFSQAIIEDLRDLGYDIEDIGVENVPDLSFQPNIGVNPSGIYVKEVDRNDKTFQPAMSQGMFRALSVLIQLNYLLLAGEPSCILIDDIGEGLDFGRSSALINTLINKIEGSSTQLIMATNDRFVMNNVPLEYWIIIQRQGSECIHYNYRNSKPMFDEFEMTGLSNFDLFSSNYYLRAKETP
ncbi:MAG: ATP-binding protein [Anaerolineae bacterium]|nr:ATP-binding protein [Anaerolineae bacterium]